MTERKKTSQKPVPLAEALQAWVKRTGLVKRMDQAVVVEEWAELVGPQIAKVTLPEGVSQDGILRVKVAGRDALTMSVQGWGIDPTRERRRCADAPGWGNFDLLRAIINVP